jgi:hypothetical protein
MVLKIITGFQQPKDQLRNLIPDYLYFKKMSSKSARRNLNQASDFDVITMQGFLIVKSLLARELRRETSKHDVRNSYLR